MTRVPTRPTSRLSTPRVGPTDACEREQRHPRPGQAVLFPVNVSLTEGCKRWGCHFNPTTERCNRCGAERN